MISVYVFSLVVGGILLGASIFLGGDSSDANADVDTGSGDELALSDSHGGFEGVLVMFLSLRFWTFFAAFFGLTGLVLDGLDLLAPPLALVAALGMGFLSASGAASALRLLSGPSLDSTGQHGDYIGKPARVLVPLSADTTGKVRLELRGSTVDILAVTDESEPLRAGETVLVIDLEGHKARVSRVDDLTMVPSSGSSTSPGGSSHAG